MLIQDDVVPHHLHVEEHPKHHMGGWNEHHLEGGTQRMKEPVDVELGSELMPIPELQ